MEHFGQNNHPRDYVDFARITKIGFCIKLHCIEEYTSKHFQSQYHFLKIYSADGFALMSNRW